MSSSTLANFFSSFVLWSALFTLPTLLTFDLSLMLTLPPSSTDPSRLHSPLSIPSLTPAWPTGTSLHLLLSTDAATALPPPHSSDTNWAPGNTGIKGIFSDWDQAKLPGLKSSSHFNHRKCSVPFPSETETSQRDEITFMGEAWNPYCGCTFNDSDWVVTQPALSSRKYPVDIYFSYLFDI